MIHVEKYRTQLLTTLETQNRFVTNYHYFDKTTNDSFIAHSERIKRFIDSNLTLTQLKLMTRDLLTLWKEGIGTNSEIFWTELENNNIESDMKGKLNFALSKGGFRGVDRKITARKQ